MGEADSARPQSRAHARGVKTFLPSEAGEVSASYADGGVMSISALPMTPPSASRTPPHAKRGEEGITADAHRRYAQPMPPTALPDFSARQLEAVLALVEYGSFVAAAAKLRISPPALTRAVQRLETALGGRLFDRTTRRVQVTAAGREFAAVAERMLADLGITVQSVREVAEERRGLVVLSSVMSVAGAFLPRLIAAYRADRP